MKMIEFFLLYFVALGLQVLFSSGDFMFSGILFFTFLYLGIYKSNLFKNTDLSAPFYKTNWFKGLLGLFIFSPIISFIGNFLNFSLNTKFFYGLEIGNYGLISVFIFFILSDLLPKIKRTASFFGLSLSLLGLIFSAYFSIWIGIFNCNHSGGCEMAGFIFYLSFPAFILFSYTSYLFYRNIKKVNSQVINR